MPQKDRERLIAHQRLFGKNLPHMKHVIQKKVRSFGIGKFVVVLPKCLGCGISIPAAQNGASVCSNCNTEEVKARLQSKHESCLERSNAAWDICRKCQGGGFGKVTCSNLDCGNFFHRERMLMDIEDVQKDLKRMEGAAHPPPPLSGGGGGGGGGGGSGRSYIQI